MPDLGQYDGSVVFSVDGDNKNIKKVLSDTTTAIDKESRKWDSSVDDSSAKMTKAMNRAFDVNRIKTWGEQLGKALGKSLRNFKQGMSGADDDDKGDGDAALTAKASPPAEQGQNKGGDSPV